MEIFNQDKTKKVASMFDNIAFRYYFLNHFLSFGIDRYWRRKAVRIISQSHKKPRILDVATGTGDLALTAMMIDPVHITGIDISANMLEIGREKVRKAGFTERIELLPGDSEQMGFPDNTFDVTMCAFGVRNFSDPVKGLAEMNRVLKIGGLVMVLEFSRPSGFPLKQLYRFYFLSILPRIGRIFSKNKMAYTYLPESVMHFPDNELFLSLLSESGFTSVIQKKLSGGIASIYTGLKKSGQ
jgi:demethylmenaquinone methyltransferase/2-methoxy-6-polyprenyl-1,4-benzoquinol methylase